jgi:hypothetical protein
VFEWGPAPKPGKSAAKGGGRPGAKGTTQKPKASAKH